MAVKAKKLSKNPVVDVVAMRNYNLDYFFAKASTSIAFPVQDMIDDIAEVSDKICSVKQLFYYTEPTEIDLSKWDLKNLSSAASMFYCSKCNKISFPKLYGDISLEQLLYSCSNLETLEYSNFLKCKPTSLRYAFQNCPNLSSDLDFSELDTSKVTTLENCFYKCKNIPSIKIKIGELVTSLASTFCECNSLKSLDLLNSNTSNVTQMNCLFMGCNSLTSLDLSSFDTSKVTLFNSMFNACSSLTSLDLSNFNTSSVTSMSYMFAGCSSLTSLDLSSFDTSKVTSMTNMFSEPSSNTLGMSNLTSITFGEKFVTTKITSNTSRPNLNTCSSLTTITIKNPDSVIQLSKALPSSVTDVYVPGNMVENYKNSDYWKNLAAGVIKELPTE